jgi:hypothetical protein
MEMEDFDFEEVVAKIMMEARRTMATRDVAQQAVERVVGQVGRFNGNDVPNFLRPYNAEMTERGVDEPTKRDFFCRVVAASMYKEVKELRGAHESWESFQRALFEAYEYAEPEGRDRH